MEYKIFRNIILSILIILAGRYLTKMYIERDWKNSGENGAIAINAENLNYMDDAIYKKMQRNKFDIPYYYFTNIRELFKPYQSGSWSSGKWGNTTGGTATSNTTTVTIAMTNLGDGAKLVNSVPTTYINALKTENNSSLSTDDFITFFLRVTNDTYINMQANTVFKMTINKGTSTEITNYAYFNITKDMLVNGGQYVRIDVKISDFVIVGTFDFTETNGIGFSLEGQVLSSGSASLEIGGVQACRSYQHNSLVPTTNSFLRRNGNQFIPDFGSSYQNAMNAYLLGYVLSSTSLSCRTFPISKHNTVIASVITNRTSRLNCFDFGTISSTDSIKLYIKGKIKNSNGGGLSLAIFVDATTTYYVSLDRYQNQLVVIYDDLNTNQTITNYPFACSNDDIIEMILYVYENSADVIVNNLTSGLNFSKHETFLEFNREKILRFGNYDHNNYNGTIEMLDVYSDFI